jgi:cobalt-zinc-cadmium efflux system membrane fusion protein
MKTERDALRALLVFAAITGTTIACGRPDAEAKAEQGHAHEHAHQEGAESDLDHPVEALFQAACEHDRLAFECDACRYEVGVVQVDPALFEAGLIRTTTAVERVVEAPITLTGEVRFDERLVAQVASRTDGIIQATHVRIGDRVTAGQPLVEVAGVALGDAQGEYLAARAARTLAARTAERQRTLRQDAITSEREALQAAQALDTADIRLRTASERLLRLGLEPADIRALDRTSRLGTGRGRLTVRAPLDGQVVDMQVVTGEFATAGDRLLTVGRTDPVRVFAALYEDQLAPVQALLADGPVPVEVTVRAFPDRTFPGTLDLLDPVMDDASRTVKARITVPNADGFLRPGMFARVRVRLPGARRAIIVPRPALQQDEGRAFVFVRHRDDYWVRRPVTPGREFNGVVEITDGLDAGRQVAVDGAFLLKSDVLRSKMGAGCAD